MPLNVPNLLTWLRILFIPAFLAVFYFPETLLTGPEKNLAATLLFAVAAVTDWLDGYLARTLDQTSAFGAFLDPVADKLMVAAAAGLVRLRRRYLVCPACGSGSHPRDGWLGLDGFLSRQAQRLACLAAASWSFDRASALLDELCGLRVSDTTIRAAAVAAGSQARAWQRTSAAPAAAFAAAEGPLSSAPTAPTSTP